MTPLEIAKECWKQICDAADNNEDSIDALGSIGKGIVEAAIEKALRESENQHQNPVLSIYLRDTKRLDWLEKNCRWFKLPELAVATLRTPYPCKSFREAIDAAMKGEQ